LDVSTGSKLLLQTSTRSDGFQTYQRFTPVSLQVDFKHPHLFQTQGT